MELDRPHPHHRTTAPSTASTSSELFICFTSHLSSSSSMKIAKSILSPGRARDPPISLSTPLSRKLRTNGSIKGGRASPMFPTGGKKKGCALENPEPSSPKVTCIGQVRVKTKKKVKQTRSLSRRRSGEVSFRKVEGLSNDELKNSSEELIACTRSTYAPPASSSSHFQQQECLSHRNQRWFHLPVTICEALRAFGAEFSCLFPCRSSCFSTNDREKKEKAGNVINIGHGVTNREEGNINNNNEQSSCVAVFARWFVAMQDCEGAKGRDIELVVGGGDEEVRREVRERSSMRSSKRHVFEDIEFKEESIEAKGEEEEEEKVRLSVCIPPKNALLLMRCRSDPMKMAALANRFWESPAPKDGEEDENEEEGVEVEVEVEAEENGEANKELEEVVVQDSEIVNDEVGVEVKEWDEVVEQLASAESNEEEAEKQEKEAILGNEVQELLVEEEAEEEEKPNCSEELAESEGMTEAEAEADSLHSFEDHLDEEMVENKQDYLMMIEEGQVVEKDEKEEASIMPTSNSSKSLLSENEGKTDKSSSEEEEEEIPQETTVTFLEEENEEKQTTILFVSDSEPCSAAENAYDQEKVDQIEAADDEENKGMRIETKSKVDDKENSSSNVLPDCLLMMMCEPKVSMEVSKETWVCSTDFIRWLPERPPTAAAAVKNNLLNFSDDHRKNKKVSCTHSNRPPPAGPLPQPQEMMTQHQQQHQQEVLLPPRSSCSLPAASAAVSMAAMIEQKLVNAVAYEPFVLTRCKSEPMRTAAAKLMPEACFWKNMKLEPHPSATFGVGAAGFGF